MRLEEITPQNYKDAVAVSVLKEQEDFVAPVMQSLAEAYAYRQFAWPRLNRDGDR